MLQLEMHKDDRLKAHLVAVGRHFGGPQYVDKQIEALDDKGLTPLCKEIMCEITGKSEADLHTLFASKGWVSQTAAQSANPALAGGPKLMGRRRVM